MPGVIHTHAQLWHDGWQLHHSCHCDVGPLACLQVYRTATAVDAAAKAQAPEYDSDDNLIVPDRYSRAIEPLKPLDHDQIEYEEIEKDFYTPAADIAALTEGQVSYTCVASAS